MGFGWQTCGINVEFITEERKNNPSVEFETNFGASDKRRVAAKDYVRSFVPASIFKPS